MGGLGTVTHLNEGDIMKENGRVFFSIEKQIFLYSSMHGLKCFSDTELNEMDSLLSFPPSLFLTLSHSLCVLLCFALGGWDTQLFLLSLV